MRGPPRLIALPPIRNKRGHQTDHNNVNDAAGRARTTHTQHATYLGMIVQGVESAPQRSKREVTHLSEIKLLVIQTFCVPLRSHLARGGQPGGLSCSAK
jgi:hypothetical protein